MELLQHMLESHDWTYHFSDDHRAYVKGRDESQKIRVMMGRLKKMGLEDESVKLYDQYRPDYL
jgi:hypothetical protein